MATQGIFNGTDLLIKVIADGGTLGNIGHTTSCSLSLSQDLPEATTKDSSGMQEVISGVRSAEISFEGLVVYDESSGIQNQEEVADFILNRNKVDWQFGTAESGDTIYSGEGFLSSVEVTAEMESPATYSGTIVVTGSITKSTNA
jgi:hypothetical protein